MIVLDYRDKRPIYEQVVEKMEHLIMCGGLEANSKLPSVRSLAMDLSVNPNTIQRAYAQLEQDGYIYTVIGRGNYVTARSEWQTGKFESLKRDFLEMLQKAYDAGMPKNELLDLVNNVYSGPKTDTSARADSTQADGADQAATASSAYTDPKEEPTND